jgi:predicted cupin superfamily sugar epimerase
MTLTAAEVIELLEMRPHPEGGHFCETWRATAHRDERPTGTAIYYLLAGDEVSHWHRVDATEIWHWYAGSPLQLSLSADGKETDVLHLGPALEKGERPQIVVPQGWWQAASSLGDWTLVGCTVSPGFQFEGFELAPPGWTPGAR